MSSTDDSEAEPLTPAVRGPLGVAREALPCSGRTLCGLCVLCAAASVGVGLFAGLRAGRRREQPPARWSMIDRAPPGVNLGGWLVLEDWFFSGETGKHVMSVDAAGQGYCLPPLLLASAEPWPSEGVLTKRLEVSRGENATADIFESHRRSFIGDTDLRRIRDLGIAKVRVPIPWATFADALAEIDPEVYKAGKKIVPDPYYSTNASFVPVDRAWLRSLVGRARGYGLKLLFDIHMMPGGSSNGTYNGVYPSPPAFWLANASLGSGTVPLTRAGMLVAGALVDWVASFSDDEVQAVEGVSLMNEPAHMAKIDAANGHGFVRDEQQIYDWLAESSDLFRKSNLPRRGVKLYVNIIDTALSNFKEKVPQWWSSTFTRDERTRWAVLDFHWYTAWYPPCSGRVISGGGYHCDDPMDAKRARLRACIDSFVDPFPKFTDGLKSCSEFSLGTYEDIRVACNDEDTLHMFLEEQVAAFERHGITGYFWTWRMPYGKPFERQWSLEYIAGLERLDPPFTCSKLGGGVGDPVMDVL